MPTVPMIKGEQVDFPLVCDHALSAALSVSERIQYARGLLDASRITIPDEAVIVGITALDRSELNRIKRRVLPRESRVGARVLAAVRQAGWDAHAEEVRLATAEHRPFRMEAQEAAIAAAVDALSDADRDAYEQNNEHELAYAYAVCDAAIECIRLPGGSTIREAIGPDFADLFKGDGYPTRWVLNRILAPSWARQGEAYIADVNAMLNKATEARSASAAALSEALGADAAALFSDAWAMLEHYHAALLIESIAPGGGSPAKHVKAARALLKGAAADEFDKAVEATNALAHAESLQWLGSTDPDTIAIEIARHIARAAMLPKVQLT